MKVLITGSNGFIGKNLAAQLEVRNEFDVLRYSRDTTPEEFYQLINGVDFICHMAGVNRPEDDREFAKGNTDLTQTLCDLLEKSGNPLPIIFASSVHVERNNPYGKSKLAAEQALKEYSKRTGAPVYIFRLPHVIGKWCLPNYNSVVATFCHNIARGLPIEVNDASYQLNIVYIDDLVEKFSSIVLGTDICETYCYLQPTYPITVGELAKTIQEFKNSRDTLISSRVGEGLIRALYATYISYLPRKDFVYKVPRHEDSRGIFVEMLKTKDSGQFSFFSAHPGITRGGHYHHSKTEKFMVIKGKARFRFRHILTNESCEIMTSGTEPEIVETIPGWSHDVTNIGDDEMFVMLWANEIFNRERPDTYISSIEDD